MITDPADELAAEAQAMGLYDTTKPSDLTAKASEQNHGDTDPAAIQFADGLVKRLRAAGFAVVPFDCPDYAVAEVMKWTHCKDANVAWEALNCALNLMTDPKLYNERCLALMSRLGAAEITLDEFWKLDAEQRNVQ